MGRCSLCCLATKYAVIIVVLTINFFNFEAIIVLFSSISYDKMFYTLAGSQISTIMTPGCSVELQKKKKHYINEKAFISINENCKVQPKIIQSITFFSLPWAI